MEMAPKEWLGQLKEFWRDIKSEMKKVTWPSRHEVIGTTGVVLVAVIVLGFYLWGCDQVFEKSILWLFKRFGASI